MLWNVLSFFMYFVSQCLKFSHLYTYVHIFGSLDFFKKICN